MLGLSDTPGELATLPVPARTVYDQPEPEELLELTVIIPARNENECLADCLESLVSQSEKVFDLGRDWELIVVDDHSTDRTAEIARGFALRYVQQESFPVGYIRRASSLAPLWAVGEHEGQLT